MHMVVRQYGGAAELADVMTKRVDEVKERLTSVDGFVAYYAARGEGDKVTTVSICRDSAGTEETTRRAAALVQEMLPGTSMSPPQVGTGEVVISF